VEKEREKVLKRCWFFLSWYVHNLGKKIKSTIYLSYMSGTWKVANFFQMRTMGYGIAEQQTSDDEADCY
jgi:hypothetical protein